MAEMLKRRARKPLAIGILTSPSWSNFPDEGERFVVTVGFGGDYQLRFSRVEAEKLRDDLNKILNDPEILEAAGLARK